MELSSLIEYLIILVGNLKQYKFLETINVFSYLLGNKDHLYFQTGNEELQSKIRTKFAIFTSDTP